MAAVRVTERLRRAGAVAALERLEADRLTLLPSLAAVALMLLWAVHNGGYDADTWYWGALVMLALLTASVVALGPRRRALSRPAKLALWAFAAYVAWSYASMAWASVPGWALEGSNRALLYLLIFALFLILPWRAQTLRIVLVVYAVGVGVVALGMLLRLASGANIPALVIEGRLAAPTGYFNSTVALFMFGALLTTALAAQRELRGLLRGFLVACACASLQICLMGQSRGWLFTLPLVVICAIAVLRDRLRVAAVSVLPIAASLIPVHRLLGIFQGNEESNGALTHAAQGAARTSLLICAAMMVLATLLAWTELLTGGPTISVANRRRLGIAAGTLALACACAGGIVATDGHPIAFVKRQLDGFGQQSSSVASTSHFEQVGSGRYDFWRVSLDAFVAAPIGGLGQDNFADYYVSRRRTTEDPRWTHSLELRLLAMTGAIGFVLFAAFLVGALVAALRGRRRGVPLARVMAAIALLPLVVWLIHGSVDWFWEMPALSGPALGFLGAAAALEPVLPIQGSTRRSRTPARLKWFTGAALLLGCVVVLGFPYLSVLETSLASGIAGADPQAALAKLQTAADLNPWMPDPTRLAGTIALQDAEFAVAQQRFRETIAREPDGWFAWLGAGLAASELGQRRTAAQDFKTAASINPEDRPIELALARVGSQHPLSAAAALSMLASEGDT